LRGERRDRGKVRTIHRSRVQVYGSRVGSGSGSGFRSKRSGSYPGPDCRGRVMDRSRIRSRIRSPGPECRARVRGRSERSGPYSGTGCRARICGKGRGSWQESARGGRSRVRVRVRGQRSGP
jgi:hypothetical protein